MLEGRSRTTYIEERSSFLITISQRCATQLKSFNKLFHLSGGDNFEDFRIIRYHGLIRYLRYRIKDRRRVKYDAK